MRGTVCIVSPGNLASNPRVLKEADALHRAGYGVTAVVCSYTESLRAFDDEIAAGVPWAVVRVRRPAAERQVGLAARWLARFASGVGSRVPVSVAARAYGGPVSSLQRAASAVRADLYIGHYVVGLAAAAPAARRHDAMLGFDAEDFHAGEGTGEHGEAFRMRMVERVEGALLPSCRHATAAAPLITKAYAARYGISPSTLLNVFPLDMAPDATPRSAASGQSPGLRAYWFSQTIGLDRGLQAFLQAMARAKSRITLDVRGGDRWGHGDRLMELARELGVADRVALLPMASPGQMVKLAAPYDVGLSLETDASENRRLCLTNKIFTYLLAGVPTMMSDTPAQRLLAPDLGAAALVVSLSDPDGMAAALDRLATTPGALGAAQAAAWKLGRERYNWDVEQEVLLQSVASAFSRRDEESACLH